MRHALRAAVVAIVGAVAVVPAGAQSPAASTVTIVQGTVQSVDRAGRTLTVRDDSGAVRRLTVARAAQASLARVRAGAFVILSLRGSVVTAIDARGVAATPAPQEVPQLPPGAPAPQNRGVPQLPPGNDAPQSRPVPQVPAASPAASPATVARPSVPPLSPRPDVSPRPVSPRPAVSPVTGPTPRPVPIPSPES